MEKVIVIYYPEDSIIGIAKDYKSAVKFLIKNYWINGNDEVAGDDGDFGRLDEVLGDAWQDVLINEWDIQNFNDFFFYNFELKEIELINDD